MGNRFEIESLAGVGGMGEVYRARDRETDEMVAVKFVRHGAEAYGARFAREARALAQIAHPGIVRFIAHGTEPSIFLAMEWLDGEDLSRRLMRSTLSIAEVLTLARRLTSALTAAHGRGVVHRDIKPSNVFLVGGRLEDAKILDFGVAQLAKSTHPLTGTGQLVGTLGYLAPEQALSGKDVTPVADVFSLGCVLFECLTGQGPFAGEGAEVLTKILLSEPARVRELRKDAPIALDELIMRMLRKAPETRATLASVAADVASILASAAGSASSPTEALAAGPAVTGDERRLLAIVLASDVAAPGETDAVPAATADTVPSGRSNLAYVVATHEVDLERLADGAQLITLGSTSAATDLATRAARCALTVRAHLPAARVAVASGRGDPSGTLVAEVVSRARELLAAPIPADRVRVDAMTAGLLDGTFEIEGSAPSFVLAGRREHRGVREILGKPTPCVGRERELSMLHGLVNECLTERLAMALVVTANAGAGKSRLVHEVLRELRERPEAPSIWIARGDPSSASTPYGMLAQIVRGMAQLEEGERPEVRRQKLLARVGRNLPIHDAMRVAPLLGEAVGAAFSADDRPQLHAARQDPALLGDYMRHAWEDLVEAEVAAGPLVIVLEDLHWGDVETVRFVDSALRAQRERPLLVLAVARPEVHEVFPAMFRSRRMNELVLTDLTPSASRRLVAELLGTDVDPATVEGIVERAGGNAFFLEELIRSTASGAPGLPDTVLAMVQAQIERLQPGARRVLRAASVLGTRFWASAVAALIRADRAVEVHATLDDLVHRELIVRIPEPRYPGEAEYVFRHVLMRDAAYEMLTERDRKAAHLACAEWLEAKGERDALALAEHLERSGERTRAVVWYLWAAEQALEASDLGAVRARVDRGIACGATGGVLGELLLLKAEASGWAGDADHLEVAEAALASLPKASPAWSRAATEVAIACGAADRARLRAIAEMLADAPRAAMTPGQAWGLARLIVELVDAGEREVAERLVASVAAGTEQADEEDAPLLRAMVGWLRAAIDGGEALSARARELVALLAEHGPARRIAVVERSLARQVR